MRRLLLGALLAVALVAHVAWAAVIWAGTVGEWIEDPWKLLLSGPLLALFAWGFYSAWSE